MQPSQIPATEIRKLVADDLNIEDNPSIDVFWDSMGKTWIYNVFAGDGGFTPAYSGRVVCDGDMEVVQGTPGNPGPVPA